jgi:hypothetical protein
MTKIYQGLGLSCMYPENWTVSEDTEDDTTVSFTLESPTHAFMTVIAYPWTVVPRQAIEQAREAMKAEYEEVEYEEVDPELPRGDTPLSDSRAVEMRFYYLDLLVVSRLVAFSLPLQQRTYLLQIQAEDRDYQSLDKVFQAIIVSLIRSLDSKK